MLEVLEVVGAVSPRVATPTFAADTGPHAWGGPYHHHLWQGYYTGPYARGGSYHHRFWRGYYS